MTSYLVAGPAAEPIALADAKAFLKVDDTAEDGLIATLITAARLHVEGITGRAMLAQTWRIVLDGWPLDGFVKLPVAPLLSLTAITAYDAAGDAHTIGLAQFLAETGSAQARLFLPPSISGMPILRDRMGLEIDYVAGYGGDAAEVPADLKQALLTLIAYWFENRDAVIIAGSGAVVPPSFDRLINPYRSVRL